MNRKYNNFIKNRFMKVFEGVKVKALTIAYTGTAVSVTVFAKRKSRKTCATYGSP